jgi:hypothetical protein
MPLTGVFMSNWAKALSSRPTSVTTTSTANPTKSGSQTYQLRVITSSASNLGIFDSSSTSVGAVVPVAANVQAEFYTVTPGSWYLPGAGMSVTEMA